jgi:gliding motility-associated-like protein
MRFPRHLIWLFTGWLLWGGSGLQAQISPDCGTAIPICNNTPVNAGTSGYGADDFGGASQTGCLETSLSGLIESNSAWYRFRTGAAGQLGFNISFDPAEDWDFALYRASDCASLGEPIRCNFYDNREMASYMGVGEDPTGSTGTYQYEPWLDVQPGEDYFLLINNFSNTNSGFSIQFSGQIFETNPYDALDCSIVSNLLGPPVAACEGDAVPLDATTSGATGYLWFADTGLGFAHIPGETGPVYTATTPATYRVQVSLPDGSTLISEVQVGYSPIPMTDPLTHEALCAGLGGLDLSTKDAEALGSQDPAAYRVSYHSSAAEAQQGANPLPQVYDPAPGSYTIYVRTTSLANPLCYDATESFRLDVIAEPVLDFPELELLCENAAGITLGPLNPEPGVSYRWSTGQSIPRITVDQAGVYTLTATAQGGGISCQTVRSVEVRISEPPGIADILIEDLQVSNRVTIQTEAPGDYLYALDAGSFQASPVFEEVTAGMHQVYVRDLQGCGQVAETIVVVGYRAFFSPNGDGVNDTWRIEGLEYLSDPQIFIFDRYGKLLKQLDQTSPGWDGTFNGQMLPATDYWFRITFIDPRGERVEARYLSSHFALKR